MTQQTIPFNRLRTTEANPRKSFDPVTIESLSKSIKSDGLLQNLVVAKPDGRKRSFTIVSGERRYRAMRLLVEQGDWPKDTPVPVTIRDDLTEEDAHRLATVENVQRENLPPLEEADAVARLLGDGESLEEVIAKTGLAERTIKRRLALCGLCHEARQALSENRIGLAQAEALTLGSEAQQRELIEEGIEHVAASRIKDWLTDAKIAVAVARFPREAYSGTLTSDLFSDDETTFFDDAGAFWQLQMETVEEMAEGYRSKGFDPVEVMEGYHFASWRYRPVQDGETGGVVIQVHNNGEVEVHEGIINKDVDRAAREATEENPFAEPKSRSFYSRPLVTYMAMHKSLAVQAALLADRRKAREVAVVQMLGSFHYRNGVRLDPHPCLGSLGREENPPETYTRINAAARAMRALLGWEDDEDTTVVPTRLVTEKRNPASLYAKVKELDDGILETLHLMLTTLCFGQDDTSELDTDEGSLFNLVATDLGIDMRNHWTPDKAFLSRRTLDQLGDIAKEAGIVGCVANGKVKKTEAVALLVKDFAEAKAADEPTNAQAKIRGWLPEAMEFPARNREESSTSA